MTSLRLPRRRRSTRSCRVRLDELPAPLELITKLSKTRHVERELLRLHVQELVLEDGGLRMQGEGEPKCVSIRSDVQM